MCFVAFIISILTVAGALIGAAGGLANADVCKLEKQDAGYIDLPNRVDSHYFYWYFESRNEPSTDPLLVWLPGGPGMGGTYGLLAENGPFSINADLSTKLNRFSWTTQANMVWVDIPVNSGFSYSTVAEDDEFTDERVAESVFLFLQGFLKKHHELQGRELFLVGESYGGHFVPSVAHYIWKKQGEHLFYPASPDSIPMNLRGIAIGNALTDPVETFAHFVDMADNPYNVTLVNETQLAAMQAASPWTPPLRELWNPYDIRQKCDTALTNMSACMPKVPTTKGYLDLPKVADLLNAGLRVLMYVGDADLLCNFYAIEATAKKLNWFGAAGFNAAKTRPYSTVSGITDAGTVRSFSHLTYVKIHNAGHMAPGDQPEVALDMISKFIGEKTL
ncbi:Serine carboxypeptidase [Phytophthora cactorum]|nr:Serine carboxypeptidase [Phytophthora cactorum]